MIVSSVHHVRCAPGMGDRVDHRAAISELLCVCQSIVEKIEVNPNPRSSGASDGAVGSGCVDAELFVRIVRHGLSPLSAGFALSRSSRRPSVRLAALVSGWHTARARQRSSARSGEVRSGWRSLRSAGRSWCPPWLMQPWYISTARDASSNLHKCKKVALRGHPCYIGGRE